MTSLEVDDWFNAVPVTQKTVFAELRSMVKSLGPDITEEIKWSRPCYSTIRGIFCYLQSTKNHATLGFQQGASLDDPGKILEGTGKDMRHVKFKNGEKINTTAVIALLKQAAS